MADVTATDSSHTATTTANTVERVTFPESGDQFEVVNWSTDTTGSAAEVLWARFDGEDATVGGDGCTPVFPGSAVQRDAAVGTLVTLKSTNAVKYTVEAL